MIQRRMQNNYFTAGNSLCVPHYENKKRRKIGRMEKNDPMEFCTFPFRPFSVSFSVLISFFVGSADEAADAEN